MSSGRHDALVSVVICAYTDRRWDQLVRAVDSVHAQTAPPHEIIVVVDHNPGLEVRAGGLDAIVIANRGRQGLSDARNTGIAVASGDVVGFLDDDAHADPLWVERIERAMSDPTVMVVGGRADAEWEVERPRWFPRSFDWVVGCSYEGQPTVTGPVRNVIGCNMAFRRSVFDEVGGFAPDMGRVGTRPLGCEETELCIRVGARHGESSVLYEPSAVVGHFVSAERGTWRYFISRCYSEGISKAAVVRRAGAGAGLASERSHALAVLPLAAARAVAEIVTKRDPWGGARAVAIVVGFTATAIGYARGSLVGESGERADDESAVIGVT